MSTTDTKKESKRTCKVASTDVNLGLVFGFGIITWKRSEKGKPHEPYFDLQEEHIPDDVMLRGVHGFALKGAPMDAMHDEKRVGVVEFSFPLTRQIAKSMNIHDADEYGWMVAVRPDTPEILRKFQTGEWTGFSIGGWTVSKAYTEGTCPECSAKMGAGNCEHQPGADKSEAA